jgi:hypothetical protein
MRALTRRLGLAVAVLGLVVGAAGQARATLTVSWQGNGGLTDFDTSTVTFAGVLANSLSFSDTDGFAALYHNHSGFNSTYQVEARVDGVFQTLWSVLVPVSDGSSHDFVSTFGTRTFSTGTVDAIRISAAPASNQSYHNFGGVQLTLDNVNVAAPEPSALAYAATRRRDARGLCLAQATQGEGWRLSFPEHDEGVLDVGATTPRPGPTIEAGLFISFG